MASQLELVQKPFIELQIEALLEENRIKQKRVNKFIDELETKIVSIGNSTQYEKLLNKTFRLPIIGRPNSLNDDYPKNFKFIPPQKLDVVGGYKTSTAIKTKAFVDLVVCMPAECFNCKKDLKNQRYHQKRALYLTQLSYILNSSLGHGFISRLEFRYHQGDFLKPVLLITPKDHKLKSSVTFQLFAYPDPECGLKLSTLDPSHGNVAPKWFFKDYPLSSIDQENLRQFLDSDSDVSSTPFYNSSILFDIESVANSELLAQNITIHSSITQALMLAKVWLYQRELNQQFSFIISMFLAYLQSQQTIHQNMSSYQIFKTLIKSIVASDWADEGFSYYLDSKDKISTFKNFFPVIFLSPSGNLNLCYNITLDLYNRLKHEALLTQNILSTNSTDTFELLFLKKLDFNRKFDVIVHLPKCTKKLPVNLHNLKKFMDHGVFTPSVCANEILTLVKQALTDRVTLIQQSPKNLLLDRTWNLKSIAYDPSNEDSTFTFGLLLDAEKSLRIIDVGPDAQTKEAEDFKNFWEPKCQLRLQNGVISETVVWHVTSFSQRRAIIKYILTHALKRIDINNLVVHHTVLERFISLQNVYFQWRDETCSKIYENGKPSKRKRDDVFRVPIGVGEEVFQRVLHSYNELNKLLRSIDTTKHSITSIQPVSHHLRGSAVFPPLPVNLQNRNEKLKRRKGVALFPEGFNQTGKILYIEPIEVLITLDSSGNWPNDMDAHGAAKLEYIIQLGESLKEKEFTVKFAENYLDVLHGQFVFRLRVKCPKELSLIGVSRGKHEHHKMRLATEIIPRVHAALDQLYRERPAFGLTCRLVKRWISCHLMTDHIDDLALDLIVAHVFLHPQPYIEPASSLCGFQRFLVLIAKHDWHQLPLVVNFDSQLKIDEVTRIKDMMQEDRSKLPPMVICTPYDRDMSPWTKVQPTEAKLDLIRSICNKALYFLSKEIVDSFDVLEESKALFRPNFKLFDILIKLNPQVVQNFFMSLVPPKDFKLTGIEPNSKQVSAFKVMPIVGLNIIEQYVGLLRKNFDSVATFFYDKYGQRVIGVLLKPDSERILKGDIDSFIKDMRKLGAKLVETVTIVKHDSSSS